MEKPSYQLINVELIQNTIQKAIHSPRKRTNYNFHELHETYQRFLNVLCKGTYIRPHRHRNPPKAETFLVLEGEIAFLIFQEDGTLESIFHLGYNNQIRGVDLQPNVWHSIICLTTYAVCFEGKHGPYEPSTDKEFAEWAPAENSPESIHYLQELEKQVSIKLEL